MTTAQSTSLQGLRGHWLPLISSRQVGRAPVPVQLLGAPLLVSRSPRLGVQVAPARAGLHGRAAASPLAAEQDGVVWCALENPAAGPPSWPYREWPGTTGSSELACNFALLVENMMDASHAAFIHGGLLRARPSRLVRYEVRETASGVVKINRGERASGSLLYRLFGSGEREFSHVEELRLPNWVRAEYQTMQGEVVFAAQFAFAPVTVSRTRVFYRVCARRPISRIGALHRVGLRVLGRLVRRVVEQDRWILEAEERALTALRARGASPRRVSTSADVAAAWAGRRVRELAAGGGAAAPSVERRVEFDHRL
jgi:phenylpropionate dioxygenase-like ring-hydroxylating dioxygenase large terminal subunit